MVKALCRGILKYRSNMAIGIERYLDAGVSSPFLNDFGVNPLLSIKLA
jgi:hypothetical protein